MALQLANHQIVTVAVYLLGGDKGYIDTEDVAVKANEIAPKRFTWKKYPDQINIENIRTFLSDAKKEKNGALLVGSGKQGWLLTERGVVFGRSMLKALGNLDLRQRRMTNKDREWFEQERARMLSSAAYLKSQSHGVEAVEAEDIKAFFRLDDYVSARNRKLKLARALNMFGGDAALGDTIRAFIEKLGGG